MKFIVDTNIIISALISPKGIIANLIFYKLKKNQLIAPHYLFDEILSKQDKISKIAGYNIEEFHDLLYIILKRIDFVESNLISRANKKQATEFTKDIDLKDTEFVAISLQTGLEIWTGDIKLIKGLQSKGFNKIITTKELINRL